MSDMFGLCKSLYYLPNISKWNMENVQNMNSMFSGLNILIVPKKFINKY